MQKILKWAIQFLFAYLIIYYPLNYFGSPIKPVTLLQIILSWLLVGYITRDRLTYKGSLALWFAPFTLTDEKLIAIMLAGLTTYTAIYLNEAPTESLIFSMLTSILCILTARATIKRLNEIALFIPILFVSACETYFLLILCLQIFGDTHKISKIPQTYILITILVIMTTSSSIINYYFLRNFIFYQKLLLNSESSPHNLNYNQKLIISVHETSHLLMYRYFNELPKDIKLLLFNKTKPYSENAQGLVIAKIPIQNTKAFIEWRMMLSISGIRGELLIFNNHSHGSESDFQEWRNLAHAFLTTYNKNYISQPTSWSEMNKNREIEIELYMNQIKIVDNYLNKNKSILMTIARKALVFNKLTYSKIHPYFRKLVMVKGQPKEY